MAWADGAFHLAKGKLTILQVRTKLPINPQIFVRIYHFAFIDVHLITHFGWAGVVVHLTIPISLIQQRLRVLEGKRVDVDLEIFA